jgi:hypothetical protein
MNLGRLAIPALALVFAGRTDAQQSRADLAPSVGVAPANPLAEVASGGQSSLFTLYANGPFVTHVGAGFGGADISMIEAGFNTFGFSMAHASTIRVADDVTVPPGEEWQLSRLHWLGYQTGAATAGTFDGAYVQIWSGGAPSSGGTVIAGDTTTNRYLSHAWTGAYRVDSATPMGSTRAVIDVVVDMSWLPALDAGTYWIDVGTTGTVASGPWANPTVPALTSDNGEQLFSGVWTPVLDGASGKSQDFPFSVEGMNVCQGDVTIYCTAKQSGGGHSNPGGCLASIGASGIPSVNLSGGSFKITATNVDNDRPGALIYSMAPNATPFSGGFLCVAQPFQRTSGQLSGGTPIPPYDCSGNFSEDFGALIQSGADPALVAGATVYAQFLYRDFFSPSGQLAPTDAVSFTICHF